MNILLIAPYRTYSGWGEGGKHLAKALNTMGHNLAIRPIYMSNEIDLQFNDPELIKLEKTHYDHYDVVIQRVLPQYFRRIPHALSILACVFETSNVRTTPWWIHINSADAILVPSKYEKQCLLDNRVSSPVYNISEAIDISKYDEPHEPITELKNSFNFYFVGECIERKNLKALLIAFHREFHYNEPVQLVIKTTGNYQNVYNVIADIKKNLRIYQDHTMYKNEMIICGMVSDKHLHNIHKNCHCLVMPSYGEAYCRPVVDALGYGNTPIVTDNTGMTDYINKSNGYIVRSILEPVYTNQPPLSDIYTARENWANIDILHLMECMRHAYETHQQSTIKNNTPNMQQFSYQQIGRNIQQTLNDLTN
jgi:glycosyltransferase involved in cell wall biosynthesis